MATNNSSNQQYVNNADGFALGGGTTARTLTVTGGNATITASGSNVYTMPAATDTLVGRASTDTLTNKTIDAAGTGNSITNVASLSVKRQNDTTNSTVAGARIETGWGVMVPGAASSVNETVTFSTAFTTAPVVMISAGGDNASATTYGSGGPTIKLFLTEATNITTTTFVAYARSVDATSWAAGNTVFYQWVAIGL